MSAFVVDKLERVPARLVVFVIAAVAAIGLLSAAACGCSSKSPQPNPGPSPRAIARGAVETLETAWLLGARSCVAVADERGDATRLQCKKVFEPSQVLLVAAADAVDAWTDADQKNIGCMLADLGSAMPIGFALLASFGVAPPQQLEQGLQLAESLTPQCVRPDAGTDAGDSE